MDSKRQKELLIKNLSQAAKGADYEGGYVKLTARVIEQTIIPLLQELEPVVHCDKMKGENFDRVIAGLERCAASDYCGTECPYAYGEESEPGKLCIQDLCRDSLELIKEQDAELRRYRKLAAKIRTLHCCIDCAKNEHCGMRPMFNNDVRRNCPQWEEESN